MRTLTLMRHAKSSWDDPSLGDHERLLNARGAKAAVAMAARLKKRGYQPDLVLVSSAQRTQLTAARLQDRYDGMLQLKTEPLLYESSPQVYAEVIRGVDDSVEHLMLIGHNPTIEWLASSLGGRECRMPTAAYIRFGIPQPWSAFSLDIFPVLDYDFPKSGR